MPETDAPPAAPRKKLLTGARAAYFILGCLLVAAAVWAITRNRQQLGHAWDAAGHAPLLLIALCLVLPIVNWACTAGTIWTLTGRYGRVGIAEMLGLIGSAWLLNLLPLRLGMIGRIAYHRRFHGIKVRQCAMVLIHALLCSIVSLALLVWWLQFIRGSLAASAPGQPPPAPHDLLSVATLRTLALVCIPLPITLALFLLLRRLPAHQGSMARHAWRWPAAILFRYADMLTWVVRYAVVFAVIGRPIPMMQAAVITVSAQAAMLTPVQLGLREWAVGATAAYIGPDQPPPEHAAADPAEPSSTSEPPQTRIATLIDAATPGLMADVMMRAAELAIILPVGFASTWWLWRRMKRASAAHSAPPDAGPARPADPRRPAGRVHEPHPDPPELHSPD